MPRYLDIKTTVVYLSQADAGIEGFDSFTVLAFIRGATNTPLP
ncbi:MAG TPA: hypothetical protein VNL69_01485 [Bacteroidota bacterium]|nr:hypothetical protein [Bacteroidota bacterium]